MGDFIEKVVTVENPFGLHVRPAASIVKIARRYKSSINFEKDGFVVDAKSVMGILMLAAAKGSKIKITAKGEDAETAVSEIVKLFEERFGEKNEGEQDS